MSHLVELNFSLQNQRIVKTFFDVRYSITEFKMKVLSVKVLLPYSNKWVNASSFTDRRFRLTILHKGLPFILEFWKWLLDRDHKERQFCSCDFYKRTVKTNFKKKRFNISL